MTRQRRERVRSLVEQLYLYRKRQLHDDLDAALTEAYGWPADLSDEEILERLATLAAIGQAREVEPGTFSC